MGMFDWVLVRMKCPSCDEVFESREFQSKDADCKLGLLKQERVNNYYGHCPKCNYYINVNKEEEQKDDRYY